MIIKNINRILLSLVFAAVIVSMTSVNLYAENSQDQIIIEAVSTSPGAVFSVDVSFVSSDSHEKNGKSFSGIGSFCIPFLYNSDVLSADSMKYFNTIASWDEKFVNSVIDTGFISLAGIYDLGGKSNSTLYTGGDNAEHVATIFFHVKKDAKPGEYSLDITNDPRQGKPYFGSADGVKAWLPAYTPCKIVVE